MPTASSLTSLVNKLHQTYCSIVGRVAPAAVPPTPFEAHLHYASMVFTLAACVLLVLRPAKSAPLYVFQSLLMTFIAHSIVFGYFRVLIGNHWVGMNSAIMALTCFIRAGMELRARKQLGGLVVVGGGVASLLWSMNTASGSDKRLLDAARWLVAIAAVLIVVAKVPLLLGQRHVQLIPATLLTIASALRVSSFRHWYDRGLAAFMVANFTVNLAEALTAVALVVSQRPARKITSRQSSRIKKRL